MKKSGDRKVIEAVNLKNKEVVVVENFSVAVSARQSKRFIDGLEALCRKYAGDGFNFTFNVMN